MTLPPDADPNPSGTAEHADAIEKFGYTQELNRTLTFSDLLIYGLIFMVPIAPFAIFGSVFQQSGGMVALAYIIAMVGMMFSANSYAQMAQAFPMTGSVFTYVGRGTHRGAGFVAGWMILLDYILVPALLYLAAALAMASFVPGVPVWAWVIVFVVLNTVINYFGITLTARVNKYMLIAELIVLAIFLVIGLWAVASGRGHFSFDAFFNPHTFTFAIVFGAASIAVLSFLGFDAISTLAEENTGTSKQLGRSMVFSLLIVGALFVVQTWVAAMLVEDPATLIAKGDVAGTAFYDAAAFAGGPWLGVLTAVATAIAWGFADAMVAQAATSRLLFAMARDRQLPKFLRHVNRKHKVPTNATFLVAAISLAIGIPLASIPDGLTVISSLVNFGALTAFLMLNVAVVWWFAVKHRSRHWFLHLIFPVLGFLVLVAVVWNAQVAAQTLGFIWLGLGIILAIVLGARGRLRDPLSMQAADTADGDTVGD
ncbi:APC family permease [Microbacterium luticocti]|uniref:APC family permease n=1 Tax=Microbacterium luticocti TaxID=451764 RepID=UPI0003F51E85|nr:APC family permease [Microbacterium luticocti]